MTSSPFSMSDDDGAPPRGLPVVRLKPKAEARAIRHGFPWVYADELVTDRRTGNLAPGALAVLEDGERQVMGLVTVNVKSKIIARMLDRDPEAVIDQAWFATRIARALALRSRLFDAPFYRLVHAEADGLPGIVIDRFGDVAVVQPNAAWAEAHLEALVAALQAVTGVSTVVKNGTGRSRHLEGLTEETVVLTGAIDGPVPVPMNGATYMADVMGGQKTGLFFDQRPNHAFAARLARGGAGAGHVHPCRRLCAGGFGERGRQRPCGGCFRPGAGFGRSGGCSIGHGRPFCRAAGRCLCRAGSAGRRGRAV